MFGSDMFGPGWGGIIGPEDGGGGGPPCGPHWFGGGPWAAICCKLLSLPCRSLIWGIKSKWFITMAMTKA